MNRVYIAAPFGNYLHFPGCTSVLGTYTYARRASFFRRWWRVLRTVRYCRGAWFNQLGLPSPGIHTLRRGLRIGEVLSLHGFSAEDWARLLHHVYNNVGYQWTVPHHTHFPVELNLSCPNVTQTAIDEAVRAAAFSLSAKFNVIAKLGPTNYRDFVEPLFDLGVRQFHLCNTIPTPYGGVSGAPLKPFSLKAVQWLRDEHPAVHIIGGGGVRSVKDAMEYVDAGADAVSLGSMLFNPFNWKRVPEIVHYIEGLKWPDMR